MVRAVALMGRAQRAICVAGVMVSTLGCTDGIAIRHPLRVGVVDPNEALNRGWREEDDLDLGRRSLDDTASLVEVTRERVCVYLRRWSLPEIPRPALDRSSLSLLGDDVTRRQAPSTIVMGPRFEDTVRGLRVVSDPGKCTLQLPFGCGHWQTPPSTEQVPADYRVENTEQEACFENDGLVTEDTTRIVLEVGHPPRAQRFEWRLLPASIEPPTNEEPSDVRPLRNAPRESSQSRGEGPTHRRSGE